MRNNSKSNDGKSQGVYVAAAAYSLPDPILLTCFFLALSLPSSSFDISSNRNREHAKRSRLRKKSLTKNLQQSANDLKNENERLRQALYTKFGREEIDSTVTYRVATPAERLIMTIQKPGNCTVDANTK